MSTPSREVTDELASHPKYLHRKGWDGKTPLSEKDRRFYALRDSGYTGPIDQDGYPGIEPVSAVLWTDDEWLAVIDKFPPGSPSIDAELWVAEQRDRS